MGSSTVEDYRSKYWTGVYGLSLGSSQKKVSLQLAVLSRSAFFNSSPLRSDPDLVKKTGVIMFCPVYILSSEDVEGREVDEV